MNFQFEFGDGNSSQVMTSSNTRSSMLAHGVDSAIIPGFRGFATMHVFNVGRNSPDLPTLNWDVSSYPADYLWAQKVLEDANPADVIRNILLGTFAKLSLSPDLVDDVSFLAAAETLHLEDHGYSRCIEDLMSADELIQSVLEQADGVLHENPITGKIGIILVRNDFNTGNTLLITPDNCTKLEAPALGGWTGRVNKVRVKFQDREKEYADGSASAHNQANAVGQSGIVEELVLDMPGVSNQALADKIAARELSARSRPLFKCTAVVDRSFLEIVPGSVVRLYWPKWGIGVARTMYLRVCGVTRGTQEDDSITLDLLQDHNDGPPMAAFEATE